MYVLTLLLSRKRGTILVAFGMQLLATHRAVYKVLATIHLLTLLKFTFMCVTKSSLSSHVTRLELFRIITELTKLANDK